MAPAPGAVDGIGVFGLNDVLRAIRAGRWTVLAAVLAGLAVAGVLAATAVRTYVSSTDLFVSVPRTPDAPSAYQASLFTQERMDTYARLLTTTPLGQQVVDDLNVPLTAEQVAGKVTAIPLPDTDILEVTVTDTSPERAQAIADSLGRQFAARVAELDTSEGAVGTTVEITVLEPATFEATPVSPSVPRYLILGAALGLLVGLALALLRLRMDGTVRSTADTGAAGGTDLVSRIPEDKGLAHPPLPRHLDGPSPATKALRGLALGFERPTGGQPVQVVVVTSPSPDEGKSTVATGLAVTLARAGSRVLLVDGNLWRPRVPRYLGLEVADRGLTDVLTGAAQPSDLIRVTEDGRLDVLPAGPMPADPGELFQSAAMRALLERLRQSYDYILVDAPPVLPVIDAAAMSASVDGYLLVTRHGRTKRDDVAEAATALGAVDGRLLGVVLNRFPATAATSAQRRRYLPDARRRKAGRPLPRTGQQGVGEDQDDPDALPAASGRP